MSVGGGIRAQETKRLYQRINEVCFGMPEFTKSFIYFEVLLIINSMFLYPTLTALSLFLSFSDHSKLVTVPSFLFIVFFRNWRSGKTISRAVGCYFLVGQFVLGMRLGVF